MLLLIFLTPVCTNCTTALGVCVCVYTQTRLEVQRSERLRVQEVESGADREQHVIIVPLVQDDEDQIADLKAAKGKKKKGRIKR